MTNDPKSPAEALAMAKQSELWSSSEQRLDLGGGKFITAEEIVATAEYKPRVYDLISYERVVL